MTNNLRNETDGYFHIGNQQLGTGDDVVYVNSTEGTVWTNSDDNNNWKWEEASIYEEVGIRDVDSLYSYDEDSA
jgi:hypothetical protein